MSGEVQVIRKSIFTKIKALEQAAQGSVTTPGSVEKMTGYGAKGCGLLGMMGLGQRLDSVILEVFPIV